MESAPLSQRVIEAIATAEGIEPADVPAPLNEVVDPDALNTLFRDTNGSVTFTYQNYKVTVDESGHVAVMPAIDP